MFEKYLARNRDFKAIEKALQLVWHPKMRFVFREPNRFEHTLVVSYDSKFIYLWFTKGLAPLKPVSKTEKYYFYRTPHKLKLKDGWQYAWRVGFFDQKIKEFLPEKLKDTDNFEVPKISGGLLTPFIGLQKKIKGRTNSPYTTEDGYLATIIHEFAHVYWNSFKMWWPSVKKKNLKLIKEAKKLSIKQRVSTKKSIEFPVHEAVGEIFAFCSEYYANSILLRTSKERLEKFDRAWLEKLMKEEIGKDLEKEDSVLDPTKNPHSFALVSGKIIFSKYPKDWPAILTNPDKLKVLL